MAAGHAAQRQAILMKLPDGVVAPKGADHPLQWHQPIHYALPPVGKSKTAAEWPRKFLCTGHGVVDPE
jgi:hypothetical protein